MLKIALLAVSNILDVLIVLYIIKNRREREKLEAEND